MKESSALRGGRRGSASFLRDTGVCRALILGLARSGLSMPAQPCVYHDLSSSADCPAMQCSVSKQRPSTVL